jgi:F0F1-type ATP synthase epsilon subunit
MELTAMEAVPVDQLDPKVITEALAETNRRAATTPANELEKAEIQIHTEVYQAMNHAINKSQ